MISIRSGFFIKLIQNIGNDSVCTNWLIHVLQKGEGGEKVVLLEFVSLI